MLNMALKISVLILGLRHLNLTSETLDKNLPHKSIRESGPMKQWALNHLVYSTLPVLRILSRDLGSVWFLTPYLWNHKMTLECHFFKWFLALLFGERSLESKQTRTLKMSVRKGELKFIICLRSHWFWPNGINFVRLTVGFECLGV